MADDGPGSPLKRRVPGATGAGPAPTAPRVLPDGLIARMRAAVDAAHKAQGGPITGPQHVAGQRGDAWSFRLGTPRGDGEAGRSFSFWRLTEPDEAEALDDLAESYLAADPDVAAGYDDDTGVDDTGPDEAAPDLRWPSRAVTTSGWDALRRDTEPGGDVRHDRAAWWDHAMQSGRQSGRAGKQDPAGKPSPAPAASPSQPPARKGKGRRQRVTAGVVVLAVVLVAGGAAALAVGSRHNTTKAVHSGASKAARVRAARLAADVAGAATWVAAQVSHNSKVACDPVTCQALAVRGVPDQRIEELGRGATGPFSARILVDTPAVRRQFGAGVAARWAPTVLAGFGLGADRITVRILAPRGARAYEAALRADRKQRQAAGVSLLASSQITTTRAARRALAAGDVDDRLLLAITALASQDPIDIVAFSQTWPGENAAIPMRCAYLAETDQATYLTKAAYIQAMIGLLRAQPRAYRPVHIGLVRIDGRGVMSIWYPAPSPLGLISANP